MNTQRHNAPMWSAAYGLAEGLTSHMGTGWGDETPIFDQATEWQRHERMEPQNISVAKGIPIAMIVWTQKWNNDTAKLYRDNITDEARRVLTRLSTNNYNTTRLDNTYTFNPFIKPVIGKRI